MILSYHHVKCPKELPLSGKEDWTSLLGSFTVGFSEVAVPRKEKFLEG